MTADAQHKQAGGAAPQSRRVSRRRARNREAILNVAERLLTAEGAEAVRVEQIADAADVSVGSIYTHFGNKEGLVVATADRIFDRIQDYLAMAYAVSDLPIEQVVATGSAYLNLLLDHPFLVRFIASGSMAQGEDSVGEKMRERITALLDYLESRIDAAIAAGQAKPVNSAYFARFLLGSWNGVVALSLQGEAFRFPRDAVEDCLYQARQIIIEGLCTPGYLDDEGRATIALTRVPRPPSKPV
ncbi:TetR/AcrR family transcriptional regulator [Hoyosella sp. YIM 151337]|uniref:TetR/AcrR family transcriptional regulator n=1 Tax=Hoyosella sp. YIM 151337 TaxID=2992742 RepID=UPI00223638D9|nr:TetR/AcrR family transcriptional regulator [Hoyosella sp. YIM 151337]MCW4354322.1 TetR/AcrR family transcriptional regulator [Hoyosella sp. YIM 151337]